MVLCDEICPLLKVFKNIKCKSQFPRNAVFEKFFLKSIKRQLSPYATIPIDQVEKNRGRKQKKKKNWKNKTI